MVSGHLHMLLVTQQVRRPTSFEPICLICFGQAGKPPSQKKAYQKLLERERIITFTTSSVTVTGDADFVNAGLCLEHQQ